VYGNDQIFNYAGIKPYYFFGVYHDWSYLALPDSNSALPPIPNSLPLRRLDC